MQVEFGGKEHEAAIAKILAAAKAAGKIAAIFCESTIHDSMWIPR
jgi:4-hydroxy-2-oxoheptanedioate aldolase